MVVLYMVIFKECKRCRFYSDSRSTACEVFILKIFLYIGRIPWIRGIEAEPQKNLQKSFHSYHPQNIRALKITEYKVMCINYQTYHESNQHSVLKMRNDPGE